MDVGSLEPFVGIARNYTGHLFLLRIQWLSGSVEVYSTEMLLI
ncbi:MAG: hypothetical protein RIG77_15130 [Cyclobacteriaceae bacterium]